MDISSQIIAELRAEIVDLKKRVSTLEEKFNNKEAEIKDVNLNGCIDLQDVSKVSLFCVFEPNASSNHEHACQNVHEPQGSPVCVSVCTDTEQRSKSASYPQISSVCSVFKKEPDPMEIPYTAGLGGVADHTALRKMNDVNTITPNRESKRPYEVPLNLDCHEELQTPLKNCSVQLVDCGNTLKQVKKRAKASKKSKCRQSSRIKKSKSKRLKHPLDCSLCIKTMSTASSLQTNKSDRTTEKIYQCSQCERIFSYFQNYVKHKKLHEKKQLRQNRDKKIIKKKQLRQNRDKMINTKKQLHQNVDKSGDTDMQIMEMCYPCTLCGQSHTYLRSTKGHMKVHSGEKPYECSYCGLRFTYPQNHMNHLKKHTGEKPYECTFCGTRFTLDLCLKEHVKLHTG